MSSSFREAYPGGVSARLCRCQMDSGDSSGAGAPAAIESVGGGDADRCEDDLDDELDPVDTGSDSDPDGGSQCGANQRSRDADQQGEPDRNFLPAGSDEPTESADDQADDEGADEPTDLHALLLLLDSDTDQGLVAKSISLGWHRPVFVEMAQFRMGAATHLWVTVRRWCRAGWRGSISANER